MNEAPLLLKTYFITYVKIKVIQNHNHEKGYTLSPKDIDSTVKFFENKKFPGVWQVQLHIEHNPKEKSNVPYAFSLTMAGFFEVIKTYPKDKVETLLKLNAPAMLYSAAREFIAMITGRGPWDEMILPSTNFLPTTPVATKRKAKLTKKKAAKNTVK